jgi:hypothetical protein
MMTEELHIVLHPVREDRVADFEHFLTQVVAPAVRVQRPDLEGRWQVLRSTAPSDGTVTYGFLLQGGSLSDDWELDLVLLAHYGQEEADRLVAEWTETFAALGPWAETAAAAGEEANQLVWTLETVNL